MHIALMQKLYYNVLYRMLIIVEYLIAVMVEVQYDYDAQDSDDLTIRVGDIIRNCKPVEDGWMEGELNGKRGMFPDNFVQTLGMYI